MSKFMEFILLVAKRAISRVFWLLDALGTILIVASLNQPKVPWYASVGVFALIIFLSCFSVWKDQKLAALELQTQLDELKNNTPSFDIKVGEVKKYIGLYTPEMKVFMGGFQ